MGNQQKRCSEFCSPGNNNQQTVAEIQIDGNNQIFPHKISQFKQVCQIYKKLGYSDQWLSQMPYKFPDSNTYYYGQFKKNLPFGYGRLINENGSFFQGEFLQGKVYCKNGLFIYPNGSYYLGQIKSNKANGNGIFVYNNNKLVQYQGEWLNDSPHGQGIEYFSDGTKYQGQFYNGIKQGNGKFTWPNGDYYIGQFSQGLIQGKGNFFCNETNYKYSGEWKKNKKNGIGIQYFDDGTKYEGNFVNNMRIGKCKILNNEEVVYEGQYQKINKEQSF